MKTIYKEFTEAGVRRANQDVCRIIDMPEEERTLLVVCDGMGGHSMGDVAAETVCNSICNTWKSSGGGWECHKTVCEAFSIAAEALYTRSRVVRPIEMGTTLVAASIEGNTITIAHCGDSRCYLLRDDNVLHRTIDHADPAMGSEAVLRCFFSLNPEIAVPDTARFELQKGDRIFLCSDGVYKSMAPQILAERLQDNRSLEDIIDVIKFLCEKYSTDNYTGILAEVL